MRPTLLLNSNMRAVSALVNKTTPNGLAVGVGVLMVKAFETPYGTIASGTKGFVDYVDPESGVVELLMEGIEPALVHWGNMLLLVPFDTDELLDCLVFLLRHVIEISTGMNVTQLAVA